jgi:hypothetical protein
MAVPGGGADELPVPTPTVAPELPDATLGFPTDPPAITDEGAALVTVTGELGGLVAEVGEAAARVVAA